MTPEERRAYYRERYAKNHARERQKQNDYLRAKRADPEWRKRENARIRNWRNKNIERERAKYNHRVDKDRKLQKAYGIGLAEFEALVDSQNGLCPICKIYLRSLKGKNVHVDHCHRTGKVRGVLCHHCNLLLGNSRESKANLQEAIAYLEAKNGD